MMQSLPANDISMKKISQERTDDPCAQKFSDISWSGVINGATQITQHARHWVGGCLIADTISFPYCDALYARAMSTLQQQKPSLCVTPKELKGTNDWLFAKLNFDVLECIFQHLDQRDLLRCAGVNKQWLWFLLEWDYFWKTIRTSVSRKHAQVFETVLYRRKINELMLHGTTGYYQGFAEALLDLMVDTHYTQLASMHIEAMQKVNPQTLSKALNTSSGNLTTLYLDHCAVPPEIVFGPILNGCPLLVELYYKQRPHSKQGRPYHEDRTSSGQRKRLALRKLKIDLGNEHKQSNTFLPDVLQRCSYLQLLFWNPIDHINHDAIFQSLTAHCPHLQWLSIVQKDSNQGSMNNFRNFRKHYIPPKSGQFHRGLTLLDISHRAIEMETSTLKNLLQVHHSTLRTVALPDDKSLLFRHALEAMKEYPLINLDKAILSSSKDRCTDTSILHHSVQSILFELAYSWEKLKSISLGYYTGNTSGVLEALVHLKELQTVNFSRCSSEATHDIASVLSTWITDTHKGANIKELSLDCKVLQLINPERITSSFQGLINLHVIHSTVSTMTDPCSCIHSGMMYKIISARKELNRRGGDIHTSTVN